MCHFAYVLLKFSTEGSTRLASTSDSAAQSSNSSSAADSAVCVGLALTLVSSFLDKEVLENHDERKDFPECDTCPSETKNVKDMEVENT